MSGPCWAFNAATSATASGVNTTLSIIRPPRSTKRRPAPPPERRTPLSAAAPFGAARPDRSEEAQCIRAIADEQVLRLLVVIQDHLMCFAAEARLLVAAERRMSRIHMIAVRPHATRLDLAADAIGGGPVA